MLHDEETEMLFLFVGMTLTMYALPVIGLILWSQLWI